MSDWLGDLLAGVKQFAARGNTLAKRNNVNFGASFRPVDNPNALTPQTEIASGLVFNLKDYPFLAAGDGVADDTAAVLAWVAAKEAAGGGVLYAPTGVYKCTSAVDLGSKPFVFQGDGYHLVTTDVFGSASWSSEVRGTVFLFPTVTNGFTVSATNYLGSKIRNLAVVGPGSGATTGINLSGTVPFVPTDDVGLFNWGVGFNPGSQEDEKHLRLQIVGCDKGIKIDGSPTNLEINAYIQLCNDGVWASTGENIRISGLVQSCLRGLNLSGGVGWRYDTVWFEGNGKNSNPTTITTTAANFTQPAQGSTVTVQMASTAGLLAGQGCNIVGGGDYAVQSITDGTHAVLVNLYNGGNAAPTTVITSGAAVRFGGAYAGPDVVFDISARSITNLTFLDCRFASDWFPIYVTGSTGTVNQIRWLGGMIGQTLTIPNRMFNVLIGCSTAAIVNNSTGPVTLLNANDNGSVTDNAGGVQGFGIYDPTLGDFVPIIGGRLASTVNELGLGCTQTGKYTKWYNGTTAYLGVKRDSSNIHIDVLDATAGGLFMVSGNPNQVFEVSFAGSGSSIFLTAPTTQVADAAAVVRLSITATKIEHNAPIGGSSSLSSPLDVSLATPPTVSGANRTLSAAEYSCPNIELGAATLSGTGTQLTFPNKRGLWLVDTSAITFGAQTLTLLAGSGAGAQVALTTSSKTLFWVQCTANNDLRAAGSI